MLQLGVAKELGYTLQELNQKITQEELVMWSVYFDLLKLQAIEFNDKVRKSSYHFDLNSGKYLRLFPIPTSDIDYGLSIQWGIVQYLQQQQKQQMEQKQKKKKI